jgi:hypothetical protein
MRADCGSWECEIDFTKFKETPPDATIIYVDSLSKLLDIIRNDIVWPAKVERFVRWLKNNYKIINDLGYVVIQRNGRIERILNITIFYSAWLKRPAMKIVDISVFELEPGEIKDD